MSPEPHGRLAAVEPLVSVVVTTSNQARDIGQTLQSVSAQAWKKVS